MGQKAILKIKTNKIYKDYASSFTGRYLFYFGGAGSGKSVDGMQQCVKDILTQHDANHKMLFIRKVGRTIQDSIWTETKQIISNWGLTSLFSFNKVEKSIKYSVNGNEIIMKGLDDPEKIKSISGITRILAEEATELTEMDFMQLDLRLRGKSPYPLQFYVMFNPVDKDHWIRPVVEPQCNGLKDLPHNVKDFKYLLDKKVWEFKKVDSDGNYLTCRTINTNYKDNRFLDNAYISTLKLLSSVSENYAQVYEHGRWGQVELGNQFLHQFRETIHVSNVERIEGLPLHYTQDFNVDPYMSGLVMQMNYVSDGFWNGFTEYIELNVIDELALKHPLNTAQDCGEELSRRYDLTTGLFLYGDASGNNRTGLKDTKTLFEDFLKGLVVQPKLRIPTQNPRYKNIAPKSLGRVSFMNLAFSGKIPLRIRINARCENFISDCKYCVQNANGQMDKKIRDGHHLDGFTYFICHPKSLGHMAKIK